jgi:hypothetical protein
MGLSAVLLSYIDAVVDPLTQLLEQQVTEFRAAGSLATIFFFSRYNLHLHSFLNAKDWGKGFVKAFLGM